MAGVLDTSRFRLFIARELNVSVRDVYAYVLGGHGDSMVPCLDYTTVAGVPVKQLIGEARLAEIVKRAQKRRRRNRRAPSRPVRPSTLRLSRSSRWSSPSFSTITASSPRSLSSRGQYGINDVFCGVPVKFGKGGVKEVVEIKLSADEGSKLKKFRRRRQGTR